MADTPQWLSERLISEGEKTVTFFKGLSPDQWDIQVYTDGSHWNIRQVLAHIALSEHSLCRLLENIANGGPGTPLDFDLDVYNERKVSEVDDVGSEDLIELFQMNRQRTAQVSAALSLEDLGRTGRHPYLGVATLSDIIKIIYRHNQIHIRDLRKTLTQV
jgi:hypothetical protein